ncbi:MAG: oxaloacetate decarboxylase subunit alpha [Candidatus Methanomethylicota archaeon]|nr:MAG: oxaloacetate decarboxylase subunit alpha [Candidatus Verstraetearchaeota archaeon]
MVKIVDLTLRDAHQSLLATRLRTRDMIPILEEMDKVGFYSLEVWGGATFDAPLRFLMEDPWKRLKIIRERVRKTKLQMLLRGQNLVGYHHYPDDLCVEFVEKAYENGIDIFRIFDALNDLRNLETTVKAAKRIGAEVQVCMVYTISPIHTLSYYVDLAKDIAAMEVDSICIKDMSGILTPSMAYELVSRIKSEVKISVDVHSHTTSGMAPVTLIKSVEAGADFIDCAVSSMSMYTSHSPAETMAVMLKNTVFDPKLNLNLLYKISRYFWMIRRKYGEYDYALKNPPVDVRVLEHQIPGGMYSNLLAQLKEQNAEERLTEVLEEIPKVRRDLGWPPLVTPLSQIVGTQAVLNVLFGRYKMIINEVKAYVKGLYGRPPAPINETLKNRLLEGEKPIKCRPADLLQPILPKIKRELPKKYVEKEEDYLTYALFPETALKFFKYREKISALREGSYKVLMDGKEYHVKLKYF